MIITFGIASYNNAKNLLVTLNTINKTMKNYKNLKYEIIIINDNSTDDTDYKFKNIKKNNIKYFKNKSNLGFGKSILKAAKLGTGKFFKIIHSGNIENSRELQIYINNIYKYKVIIPYIIDKRVFYRKFISKLCTFIFNLVSGKNIKYYQSPLMCYRKEFIKLFPKNNFGNFFLSTIIYKIVNIHDKNYILEFGITPKFKKGSTALSFYNFTSLILSIATMINLRIQNKIN
tara:strand:+ start:258 stop:950 length:693 start_codon:yes stop_codon:yes gene_type:complete